MSTPDPRTSAPLCGCRRGRLRLLVSKALGDTLWCDRSGRNVADCVEAKEARGRGEMPRTERDGPGWNCRALGHLNDIPMECLDFVLALPLATEEDVERLFPGGIPYAHEGVDYGP